MTPPNNPRRRRGAGTPAQPVARKPGAVRRSQLVTTYGVGSMIAIDNESFIVAGLDSWDVSEAPVVYERRLAQILGVKSFRLPPAPDPDLATGGVVVHRFPEFYSCPECKALQPFFKFNSEKGKAQCDECCEALVPSRFVIACNHGHIEDFPFWKWVHRGADREGGKCGGSLSLHTDGSTASLRSVVVRCDCGVPEASMEGAFRSKALKDLGIGCSGRRPWLKGVAPESCDQPPRAMQRGSSSAWHPLMNSALSIPPWGEGLYALVEQHKLGGKPEGYVRMYFEDRAGLLAKLNASVEDVINVVKAFEESDSAPEDGEVPVVKAGSKLRRDEYEALVRGRPEVHVAEWQPFVCETPDGDLTPILQLGLRDSMLVKRLREVRVLSSFVRGEAPTEADAEQRQAQISSKDDPEWLPAMEVSGEGVFLRLDADRLAEWESDKYVIDRSEDIRANHNALLRERGAAQEAKDGKTVESHVTPRLLLLHTLAHALINEWSLDAGYPASALRERLYADGDMAGVLIYTATSDSAGSLGGIVAQGEPDKLARTLRAALARAEWCSNDPLCMEAEASGAGSVNKAACHACVLLPETSCEHLNGFLDRAMLVGDQTGKVPGYFTSAR
ncbi:DUF1998 domain-containing protein [Rhodococcus sp. W8901]|uniref:DUF1998 domain-containing protein n=1 Tax=Rhodococcus sp. W8901 TaxID=2742603 RepID=UPI0015828909|nr:DUF1998 domain-containing protein [Rhodococcus sp. W8901]QKT10939.1 DUF1998 domain-containing protein [Rhodococcus sp. W8901]